MFEEPKIKTSGHWSQAGRLWEQIGFPLRPCQEDIAFAAEAIDDWTEKNGAPRALILGVTPELHNMSWPQGTSLLAIDHTQEMIDAVWPGQRHEVICAHWPSIPLKPDSRDIVLCDGGIHLMQYPVDHNAFIETLQRIIAPGGLCIFRLFVPPEKREAPEHVLEDLLNSKIPNLNVLKLRLGMSLQSKVTEGVELKKVWDTLHRAAPDFEGLARKIHWPLEHLLAINTYRDSPNRYYFLTLDHVLDFFCKNPGGFELKKVYTPTYELAERCPTVVLQKNESS